MFQQVEGSRFPLRIKLFLTLLSLSLFIAIGFTYTIYNSAYNLFFETYLDNKLSLAKIAARSIKGDSHKNWSQGSIIGNPEFEETRQNLKSILELAENAKYLYTVNYDKQNDRFLYSATGGVVKEDTIWVENDEIAFQITWDKNENLQILFNEEIFSKSLKIQTKLSYNFEINQDEQEVSLNNLVFFKVTNLSEKEIIIDEKKINLNKTKLFYKKIDSQTFQSKFQFFFTAKNDFDTLPGAVFTNSPEYFKTMKKLIQENKDEVDYNINANVYGRYYSARAVIRDSKGLATGITVIEISETEIINFKNSVTSKLYFVSVISFGIIFILVFLLTSLITKPIKVLSFSAKEFANGNLSHRIEINSGDEFQTLANSFNIMAEKILEGKKSISDYAENLEVLVDKRTNEIQVEKEKSEALLLNILPRKIAKELKEKGEVIPVQYQSVSIMFTDFVGFTKIAMKMSPNELIERLNHIFLQFDLICSRRGVEKLKTIGDAYMCAGGMPNINSTHPIDICLAALEMKHFMSETSEILKSISDTNFWDMKIGIHTGQVIAGVVGKSKFTYDIWGDSVNIASRMESTCEKGRINISEDTYNLVKDFFEAEERGLIEIKNHGSMKLYFLNGIKKELSKDDNQLIPNQAFFSKLIQF